MRLYAIAKIKEAGKNKVSSYILADLDMLEKSGKGKQELKVKPASEKATEAYKAIDLIEQGSHTGIYKIAENTLRMQLRANRFKVYNMIYVKSSNYIKGKYHSLSILPDLKPNTSISQQTIALTITSIKTVILAIVTTYANDCMLFEVSLQEAMRSGAVNIQNGKISCEEQGDSSKKTKVNKEDTRKIVVNGNERKPRPTEKPRETINNPSDNLEQALKESDRAYIKYLLGTVNDKNTEWSIADFKSYMHYKGYTYKLNKMTSIDNYILSEVDSQCKILHVPVNVVQLVNLFKDGIPENLELIIPCTIIYIDSLTVIPRDNKEMTKIKSIAFQQDRNGEVKSRSIMIRGLGLEYLEVEDTIELALDRMYSIENLFNCCKIRMNIYNENTKKTQEHLVLSERNSAIKTSFNNLVNSVIKVDQVKSVNNSFNNCVNSAINIKSTECVTNSFNNGTHCNKKVRALVDKNTITAISTDKSFNNEINSKILIRTDRKIKSDSGVIVKNSISESFNNIINSMVRIETGNELMLKRIADSFNDCEGLSGIVNNGILNMPNCLAILSSFKGSNGIEQINIDWSMCRDIKDVKLQKANTINMGDSIDANLNIKISGNELNEDIVKLSATYNDGMDNGESKPIDFSKINIISNEPITILGQTMSLNPGISVYNMVARSNIDMNLPSTLKSMSGKLTKIEEFDSRAYPNMEILELNMEFNSRLTKLIIGDNIKTILDDFRLAKVNGLDTIVVGKNVELTPYMIAYIMGFISGKLPNTYIVNGSQAHKQLKQYIDSGNTLCTITSSTEESIDIINKKESIKRRQLAKLKMLTNSNNEQSLHNYYQTKVILSRHEVVDTSCGYDKRGLDNLVRNVPENLNRDKFNQDNIELNNAGTLGELLTKYNNSFNIESLKSVRKEARCKEHEYSEVMVDRINMLTRVSGAMSLSELNKEIEGSIQNFVSVDQKMWNGRLSIYLIRASMNSQYAIITERGTGSEENNEYIRYICNYVDWTCELHDPYIKIADHFVSPYGLDGYSVGIADILQPGDRICASNDVFTNCAGIELNGARIDCVNQAYSIIQDSLCVLKKEDISVPESIRGIIGNTRLKNIKCLDIVKVKIVEMVAANIKGALWDVMITNIRDIAQDEHKR